MNQKALFIFIIMLFSTGGMAENQRFGLSGAYGSANAFFFYVFYKKGPGPYHLGFSRQITDLKGKLVTDQQANDGRTGDGTGEYFSLFEMGYGYHFRWKLTLYAEFSPGVNYSYTNYVDGRFNDGGYHMIDAMDFMAGFGATAGYEITDHLTFLPAGITFGRSALVLD